MCFNFFKGKTISCFIVLVGGISDTRYYYEKVEEVLMDLFYILFNFWGLLNPLIILLILIVAIISNIRRKHKRKYQASTYDTNKKVSDLASMGTSSTLEKTIPENLMDLPVTEDGIDIYITLEYSLISGYKLFNGEKKHSFSLLGKPIGVYEFEKYGDRVGSCHQFDKMKCDVFESFIANFINKLDMGKVRVGVIMISYESIECILKPTNNKKKLLECIKPELFIDSGGQYSNLSESFPVKALKFPYDLVMELKRKDTYKNRKTIGIVISQLMSYAIEEYRKWYSDLFNAITKAFKTSCSMEIGWIQLASYPEFYSTDNEEYMLKDDSVLKQYSTFPDLEKIGNYHSILKYMGYIAELINSDKILQ